MTLSRHPGYGALNRFADGELAPRRHERVARHLADCRRCRQEVAFIRQAGDLARSLEPPPRPDHILAAVLERRGEGDRVLLPLEPPGARPARRPTVLPAAAAVLFLVLFVAGLFLSTGLLEADRPGVHLEPERPRAGDRLSILYEGSARFSDRSYLRLRARYRTASGIHWDQTGAMLSRVEGNEFRGELALPDSVVYVAFSVEDLEGAQVDSRHQELWDVMVHDARGRPTAAALDERIADLPERNSLEALRTAERLTKLYPDSPRGWSWLWHLRQGFAEAEARRQAHEARLKAFERAFTEEPPSDPEELAELAWYAALLDDWASADFWAREAEARGARSAALFQTRAIHLRVADRPHPQDALARLETLWSQAPAPLGAVADAGWHFALQAADWQAAMRWLPRYALTRQDPIAILQDLELSFGLERALDWALASADDLLLRASAQRLLYENRGEHQRFLDRQRQRTLAAMARMALASGRTRVASGLAVEALPLAWETAALESIGTVLLDAGDTVNAMAAFARAAADPLGAPPPESVVRMPDWHERVETARSELTRYVLQESVIRYPFQGTNRRHEPGVAAFVFSCGNELAELSRVAERLAETPFKVYSTLDASATPARLRECGLEVPAVRDITGEVGQAFRVRTLPSYFVVDADGRIRFEHSRLDEIPRQLMALHRTAALTVGDD